MSGQGGILQKIHNAMAEGTLIKKTFRKILFIIDPTIGVCVRKILSLILKVKPNKIVFITDQGEYICNPKYITEQLIRENITCDIVWAVRKEVIVNSREYSPQIKFVEWLTLKFYYQIARAKIIIINSVAFPAEQAIHKKNRQIMIQTWHGSLGIKKFGAGAHNDRNWVEMATHRSQKTDFCISNSSFEDMVYRTTFWPETEILQYGHPRNDILFPHSNTNREEIKEKILSLFGIKGNPKIALFAPTFRDNREFFYYSIQYDELLVALKKRFTGDWIVFAKFHLGLRDSPYRNQLLSSKPKAVIDVTDYVDIQELLLIADVGLTDYSSWIFDYLITGKPGFIYAVDIAEYIVERGLYYPLEATPFPIATNNYELCHNILSFDEQLYKTRVEEFLIGKGCVDDGHASERVVGKILDIIECKK